MAKDMPTLIDCPSCGGSGRKSIQVLETFRDGKGNEVGRTVTRQTECPDCGGAGQIYGGPPA